MHEEITIETKPPCGDLKSGHVVSSKENISIPVKKEEIEKTKTPYVKEEKIVKRKEDKE